VVLLFLAGGVLRGGAVLASPEPVIDVYAWVRDASGLLLEGKNPYAAEYQSPYGTERARRKGVGHSPETQPAAYPPLPILFALPLRAVGITDVRWANVACDLLAAWMLLAVGRRRGRPLLGAIAAGAYLHL